MDLKNTIRSAFLKIAKRFGLELKKKDYPEDESVNYYDKGLNPIAIGANVISTLTLDDSTIEIKGESARAKNLAEIVKYYQENQRATAVEISAGTGDCLLRPYTDGKRIGISLITNSNFAILESIGDYIKSIIIHLDGYTNKSGERYDLYEFQRLTQTDGKSIVTVERIAYKDQSNKVDMANTQWKEMQESQTFTSEQLLFGRIKCPTVNRENPNSVNGVPITFGCENVVKEIRDKYLQYNKEFDKKQAKIFADRTMFAGGEASANYNLPNDDVYQMITGDSANGGVKSLLDIYSPDIRDESFKNASDFNFAMLELCCGLSKGVFTKPETSFSTATEMKNSLKKTFAFMKKFRHQIDSGEKMLISAINILMNLNGISPMGDYEVYSDWSDNYVEEMKERFNELLQLHNQGVITDAELRAWGMDEDLKTAESNIQKIKSENPQPEML